MTKILQHYKLRTPEIPQTTIKESAPFHINFGLNSHKFGADSELVSVMSQIQQKIITLFNNIGDDKSLHLLSTNGTTLDVTVHAEVFLSSIGLAWLVSL